MTAPAGKVSVKVSPVLAGAPAGLVIVKVSTEFCPTPTVVGLNAFVSVGQRLHRERRVHAVVVTVAWPRCCRRSCWCSAPAVLLVTSTVTVHEAWAAFIVAPGHRDRPRPGRGRDDAGADGHELVTFGVPAITTLAGSVSVKLIPDCAGLPAPFVSVKVSVEVAALADRRRREGLGERGLRAP